MAGHTRKKTDWKSKNLPAKKYDAGQRTEKMLRFAGNGDRTFYIDIAKALSEVNRKHYRQGLYYYVQNVEFIDTSSDSTLDIYTLADTWVTKNAWIRAYNAWQTQQHSVDLPQAKYSDFKIRMTSASASGTVDIPIQGGDGSNNNTGTGGADEWNRSEIMYNKTAETGGMGGLVLYMTGGATGAGDSMTGYGLIEGYMNTRRNIGDITSADDPVPDAAQEDKLAIMGTDGHPEVASKLVTENDLTPYDHDDCYGTAADDLTRQFRLTTSDGLSSVGPGFCAPLGLLKCVANVTGDFDIAVTLAPGPYHGVYAERVYDEQ